jgi:hypothetical protein
LNGCRKHQASTIKNYIKMNKISIFIELIQFLIKNKRYWIIPIIIVLVLLGMLLILTESSVLSPFIYSLF